MYSQGPLPEKRRENHDPEGFLHRFTAHESAIRAFVRRLGPTPPRTATTLGPRLKPEPTAHFAKDFTCSTADNCCNEWRLVPARKVAPCSFRERLTASPSRSGAPKRIIFFLQNQGFDPTTCIPEGMHRSGSLAKARLPEPIEALEPEKERLHIINGLHGLHTSPSHIAFFGPCGGHRGDDGTPPFGSTIDYELSRLLPQTPLPHLCIGMDSIENMTTKPTIATLSASGAGQPIFRHSKPESALSVAVRRHFLERHPSRHTEARSNLMNQILNNSPQTRADPCRPPTSAVTRSLSRGSRIRTPCGRLDAVSDRLRKFAPTVDERYSRPKFETDWHDVLLDLGISAWPRASRIR